MEKKYGIKYLRKGEWTLHPNKNGGVMRFSDVGEARVYINKARDNEPNNPVTFMNRVYICELNDNDTIANVIEHF